MPLTFATPFASTANVAAARGWLRLLQRRIARCLERHRQRQALAELDDERLRDIGISRDEAKAEYEKPCWR
jgi:uncharacterized protein YjiS (DUF1127 family)